MSRNINPITVCCAAVLMLGLAACGSDDNGGTATMMEMPTPVEVGLSGVAAGAKRAAGTAEIAAGESADIGEVTFTCAAGGDACSVTVGTDGDATATGGMVTAATSAAYTTRMVATAAADTKQDAMAAEAAQAVDDGPGGMVATTDHTIGIGHDGTGATVTIAPAFERAEVVLDGGRSMHVRAMPADAEGNVVEEVIIVATDIEAPKEVPFSEVHMLTVNPNEATPPVNQSLQIDADSLAMMETDGFTATGGATITLEAAVADDPATMDVDETVAAFQTDATFDGAPGTLTCGGSTNCTVTLDAMGDITAVTGGWIFTPDEDAMAVVADADYLHYGFWLKRTRNSDGAVTRYEEVETFADSSVDASGDVRMVEGTASYQGGAVGVYAIRNAYDSRTGELVDATSGHFKADASLKAYFGGDDVTVNMKNSVTGTIDNFALSGGEANDWSVALKGSITDDATGTASGTAAGGGTERTFSATFHGPAAVDTPPHSVVGEFNADFDNGAVAGAFGARKPPESE